MATVRVRVRMFPDPIEVDDAEIPNLRSQGLLIDDREALLARREALAAELQHIDDELKQDEPASTDAPAKPAPKQAAKATTKES